MAVFFGQFLNHDMVLSPKQESKNCCDKSNYDTECIKIELPPDDPFYSQWNKTCLPLTRSQPHCSSGWPPKIIREQQNLLTSYLDANNVYGLNFERSRRLRTMIRGRLKVSPEDGTLPEEELQRCRVPIAGDERAMENPNLASLHTLFLREHNNISDRLWHLANWTKFGNDRCDNDKCDELLYQNTRRILIAEWQHIVYNEWLPLIIGESRMNEFHLNGGSIYKSSVDPSIIAAFSTAAFRFGHSMSNGIIQKINPLTSKVAKNVNLSDTLFITNEYKGTGTDMILAGLCNLPALSLDSFGSTQLTNFMFKHSSDMNVDIPRFGKDLFAINIARGRDHGIPSYAQFYEKFGPKTDFNRSMECWLTRPKSFNGQFWDILKNAYICPKDIDLFVGGLLEAKMKDQGVLGSIFGWIVAEQFRRLRDGDRFFFTHTGTLRLKMYALVRENISHYGVLLLVVI